jgi:hypothetical protein
MLGENGTIVDIADSLSVESQLRSISPVMRLCALARAPSLTVVSM